MTKRKPKFVFLTKQSQIRELVPGDLVSLSIAGGMKDYEFHAVYEGKSESGFSFLDVDFFQYLRRKGGNKAVFSYRTRNERDISVASGMAKLTHYIKEDFQFDRCFYIGKEYPKKMLDKKMQLVKIGERLLNELYIFDEVILQDKHGRAVKTLKNVVLR